MEGDNQTLADLLKDNGYNTGSPEFIGKLPKAVKKRVCALKKVQQQSIEVEAKFYERVHQLEKEFELEFNKLYEQRRKIVTGEYEPTDEESNLPIIHGIDEEDLKALNDKSEPDNGEKGVSEFWLNVLKGSDMTADMIQDHDEPILKYLVDITTSVELEPQGFTIYFHFSPNEYFKNSVLKKQYFLQMKPDSDDPFEFDGPSVIRAAGDEIQWEDGKNVTKKVVKKKQKKGANAGRFITKTVRADSFFNFFDTIKVDEHKNEDEEQDEDTTELMRADFEIGQVLRDNIIPRAVLYYTGEADVGDDMYDFDGEDGDDDVSDEEDEE